MDNSVLRLNGKLLRNMGRGRSLSMNKIAKIAEVEASTVGRYLKHSGKQQRIDLNKLSLILFEGLEVNPEQLLNMKLGDVFDLVPE